MSQHGNWIVFKSVPLRLISWEATFWLRKLLIPNQKLLMSKSTIESNGLHYPDVLEFPPNAIVPVILEPSPCYFAGCVPNMPCKVKAYEKFCAEQYEPTNLDDLVY